MTVQSHEDAGTKTVAKVLYGLLFTVALPILLVILSVRVDIGLTIARLPVPGALLASVGLVVMLLGMWDLRTHGKGLPMNAFPPSELVVDGVYAAVPHPIYTGFVLMCLGMSLFCGSSTGVFLTTPLVALSAIALVLGYERPYLLRVFGRLPHPVLGVSNVLGPIASAVGFTRLWATILHVTERLANSWGFARIGSLRVINHAVWAGLAGGVGAFLVVLLAGREEVAAVCILMVAGLVGAALVGQLLVGSSGGLSRPFGYFGGLLGIAIVGAALLPFHRSMLLVLAAFCFAGPWTQALGRVRCIVQGCCHGAPSGEDPGIVVCNEHSRVSLAGLGGKRIYPTQLYSILGNVMIAVVLTLLWFAGAQLTLIGGLYLVLAGLVRFVEEGYRGEPLTKVIAGLHLYQWFAVTMVVVGSGVMMAPSPEAPPIGGSSLIPALIVGIVFFLVCGFAMGVDFPESQKRFSRLSG